MLMRARNLAPMLVLTFIEKGGFHQIIWRFLLLFFLCPCSATSSSLNSRLWSYLLLFRASWYKGFAWLKRSLLALREDNLLFTAGPMFFSTFGGWFDWQ